MSNQPLITPISKPIGLGNSGNTLLPPDIPGTSNDKIVTGIILILAVFVVTLFAGLNAGLGKVLAIVMGGFLLAWALTSGGNNDLMKWTGMMTTNNSTQTGGGISFI